MAEGINFGGLNPESNAKLNEIIADGVLSIDERSKLTAEEIRALEAAFKINLEETEGEIKLFKEEPQPAVTEAKEEKPGLFKRLGNWFKNEEVPTWKKALAGLGIAAAAIGVLAAPHILSVSGAIKAALLSPVSKTLAIGALVVGGAVACSKTETPKTPDVVIEGDEFYVYNNVQISMNSVDSLAEAIANLDANNQQRHNDLMKKMDELIKQTGSLQDTVNFLVNTVQMQLESVIKLLQAYGTDITQIINLLEQANVNLTDINCGIMGLLDGQQNLTDAVKQGVSDILNKLNTMSEDDKKRFDMIYPLLVALGDSAASILAKIAAGQAFTEAELEAIKKAILENNKIAQGTQDAVNALKDQMAENHKAILDKIVAGTASLDEMKELLKGIKTGVDNNTLAIGDIKQFVNIIGSAIEKLLSEVQGIRVETKEGLLAILAKIPNGCKCQPTDLSAVLDLLNKLLEEVQKDPTDNTDSNPDDENSDHEGILKDLEDYFG